MVKKQTKQDSPVMTTSSGRPVGDNQNSITAGPRGPVLMEDYLLFEKMAQGALSSSILLRTCFLHKRLPRIRQDRETPIALVSLGSNPALTLDKPIKILRAY